MLFQQLWASMFCMAVTECSAVMMCSQSVQLTCQAALPLAVDRPTPQEHACSMAPEVTSNPTRNQFHCVMSEGPQRQRMQELLTPVMENLSVRVASTGAFGGLLSGSTDALGAFIGAACLPGSSCSDSSACKEDLTTEGLREPCLCSHGWKVSLLRHMSTRPVRMHSHPCAEDASCPAPV